MWRNALLYTHAWRRWSPLSVGFADASGYKLVIYEVTKATSVLESTNKRSKTKQLFSTIVQSNLKKLGEMIEKKFQLLDEVIKDIKIKIGGGPYNRFEFYIILTLELLRYELFQIGKMSDRTADAVSQLFAFRTHELYYRDHPDLYNKCLALFNLLRDYNVKLKNHDLPGKIGIRDEEWKDFFVKSISGLLKS